MKKLLLAAVVALFATNASALIAGSSHDLHGTTSNGACMYCHMPHHSNTAVTAAPIWSRTVFASSSYTMKNTSSGQVPNLGTTQNSLLCLSCHDGVVSMTTLWNGQALGGSAVTLSSTGAATNIGTDLRNDHPVGVTYATAGTSANATGLDTLANAQLAGYMFFGTNNLECGSCHDPHNDANGKFYRVSGDRCVGCHKLK